MPQQTLPVKSVQHSIFCTLCIVITFIESLYSPYYAALLPRGGGILRRTLSVRRSVCLSVRPVIVAIGNVFSSTASVTDVLFGMHWGPHIVRPSPPHKFLF